MADETKLTAATRLEKLLDNIAGGENEVTPATRLEKFLSYIADAMEGGGGGSGVQLYGPYTAINADNVDFGNLDSIIFGAPSIFTNRLVIYDMDNNIKQWNDTAKCIVAGVATPNDKIITTSWGSQYGEGPVITVLRLDGSITRVSRETVLISFYTDVELTGQEPA